MPAPCPAPTATCRAATCTTLAMTMSTPMAAMCGETITRDVPCGMGGTCDASGECQTAGAVCPNGQIEPGEDCEVGSGAWTASTCGATTCKRLAYQTCTPTSGDCPGNCNRGGVCGGRTCSASDRDCGQAPPDTTAVCYRDMVCALRCTTSSQCPTGLKCVMDALAGGPANDGICLASTTSCTCDDPATGCTGCLMTVSAP
jgi:hypothetical protein